MRNLTSVILTVVVVSGGGLYYRHQAVLTPQQAPHYYISWDDTGRHDAELRNYIRSSWMSFQHDADFEDGQAEKLLKIMTEMEAEYAAAEKQTREEIRRAFEAHGPNKPWRPGETSHFLEREHRVERELRTRVWQVLHPWQYGLFLRWGLGDALMLRYDVFYRAPADG